MTLHCTYNMLYLLTVQQYVFGRLKLTCPPIVDFLILHLHKNVNGNLLLREKDLVLAYTIDVCVLHVHQWHILYCRKEKLL